MDVNGALKAVMDEVPESGNMRYAKTYARAAMDAALEGGVAGLRVQVAYVLANLVGWKGDRAQEVKAALRGFLEAR